jgi:hypothetical protein
VDPFLRVRPTLTKRGEKMKNYLYWLSLLAGSAITLALQGPGTRAENPNRGDVVELGGLKSRVPADWVEVEPDDARYYKQYRLAPVGDGVDYSRVTVHFLRNGGPAAEYVRRWKGMFLPPEGKTMREAAKVRHLTVNGASATYLDVRGDYKGIPGDAATPREDYGLLGVYLDTPKGPYIILLFGPDEAVRVYRQGFENWVKAFK